MEYSVHELFDPQRLKGPGRSLLTGREFIYDYEKYKDLNPQTFSMYYELDYYDTVREFLV